MDLPGNSSCGSFDDGQGVRYEETYKMKIIEYDERYKQDFMDFNSAWITDNFSHLDPEDIETFENN